MVDRTPRCPAHVVVGRNFEWGRQGDLRGSTLSISCRPRTAGSAAVRVTVWSPTLAVPRIVRRAPRNGGSRLRFECNLGGGLIHADDRACRGDTRGESVDGESDGTWEAAESLGG